MKRYKFLKLVDGQIKSDKGDCIWKLNKWKHTDKIDMCNSGFHCSKEPWQAFSYVQGEILAEVEYKGESIVSDNKEVYSDMRIIKTWKWQKKDSVALAIYSAELCIDIFEKKYPNDKRPREAIESAKKWLLEPTEENRKSAEARARAAWSAAAKVAEVAEVAAWSASAAAEAAAWSEATAIATARSTSRSASAAAEAAAWSAEATTEAALTTVWEAAESAMASKKKEVFTKISKWFDSHIKELEIYG